MFRSIYVLFLPVAGMLFLQSCASRSGIVYFQNIESVAGASPVQYEPVIQPDDLLLIYVSADQTPEAASPFNLSINMFSSPDNPSGTGQRQQQLYLVDQKGMIDFPVLGRIQLGGFTRSEAIAFLEDRLRDYIKDPILNFRITNFKVTVEGEVVRPGVHRISTERITLMEALALSGDLTVYGKRDNILVIREQNGQKTYNRIDITRADFINSPFYYLRQNDVVYVEPNKTRVNSSVIGPNVTVAISAISLLITIIALSTR